MSQDSPPGLVCAFRLGQAGSTQELDWNAIRGWRPAEGGTLWPHLDRKAESGRDTLICRLEDRPDGLEQWVPEKPSAQERQKLSGLHRESPGLRRYLAPQREVLSRLATEAPAWFEDRHRAGLREVVDRRLRDVEDWDAIPERTSLSQEELPARQQDRMNWNMSLLSLVADLGGSGG